jgi:hypothetical protein
MNFMNIATSDSSLGMFDTFGGSAGISLHNFYPSWAMLLLSLGSDFDQDQNPNTPGDRSRDLVCKEHVRACPSLKAVARFFLKDGVPDP